jgi:hypothetical protein
MVAGHLLLSLAGGAISISLLGIVGLISQTLLMCLEMAVAMIQAYVFMVLVALYAKEVSRCSLYKIIALGAIEIILESLSGNEYSQYHWCPITPRVRSGVSTSSIKYNSRKEGRARQIKINPGSAVQSSSNKGYSAKSLTGLLFVKISAPTMKIRPMINNNVNIA